MIKGVARMTNISLAVEAKREGKLNKALEYYEKQLDETGVSAELFQSIAEIYYLNKQNTVSIMFYLAATHLSLHYDNQQYNSGDARIKNALDELPTEYRGQFPHPIGDMLIYESNLPKQIGHAYMDHETTFENEPEFKSYAEIYAAELLGDGSDEAKRKEYRVTKGDSLEMEAKRYMPIGFQVLVEHIEWSEIDNPNVIELYMKGHLDANVSEE